MLLRSRLLTADSLVVALRRHSPVPLGDRVIEHKLHRCHPARQNLKLTQLSRFSRENPNRIVLIRYTEYLKVAGNDSTFLECLHCLRKQFLSDWSNQR